MMDRSLLCLLNLNSKIFSFLFCIKILPRKKLKINPKMTVIIVPLKINQSGEMENNDTNG